MEDEVDEDDPIVEGVSVNGDWVRIDVTAAADENETEDEGDSENVDVETVDAKLKEDVELNEVDEEDVELKEEEVKDDIEEVVEVVVTEEDALMANS